MGFFVHDVVEKRGEREAFLASLNLSCKLCGSKVKLVRDHDHDTGMIRGILCDRCNRCLGIFENGVEAKKRGYKKWLAEFREAAEDYLIAGDLGVLYVEKDSFFQTMCELKEMGII